MLALCLMPSDTNYAENYASIIGWCLATYTYVDIAAVIIFHTPS